MAYIVTFTGNEGAGKSTILTNLACELADAGTTVGVLSTDLRWQQLPVLLAGAIIRKEMSLGELFSHDNLVGGFAEYPHCRNLFVAGPERGASCIAHEPPDKQALERFVYMLSSTFDYVLIEANEVFFNQFSAVAVQMANAIINVTEATELGMAYELSNYELLSAFRKDIAPIDILNADDGDLNVQEAQKHCGHGFQHTLPYHKLVRRSSSRCMPVQVDSGATGTTINAYRKKITAIANEIKEAAEIAAAEQRRRNEMAARKAAKAKQAAKEKRAQQQGAMPPPQQAAIPPAQPRPRQAAMPPAQPRPKPPAVNKPVPQHTEQQG